MGDFLLKCGDKGEEWQSCSLSLRLSDSGVTGGGEGIFCEGNKFPREFFDACCVCSDPELARLACETDVFLGVIAALCRGVK